MLPITRKLIAITAKPLIEEDERVIGNLLATLVALTIRLSSVAQCRRSLSLQATWLHFLRSDFHRHLGLLPHKGRPGVQSGESSSLPTRRPAHHRNGSLFGQFQLRLLHVILPSLHSHTYSPSLQYDLHKTHKPHEKPATESPFRPSYAHNQWLPKRTLEWLLHLLPNSLILLRGASVPVRSARGPLLKQGYIPLDLKQMRLLFRQGPDCRPRHQSNRLERRLLRRW